MTDAIRGICLAGCNIQARPTVEATGHPTEGTVERTREANEKRTAVDVARAIDEHEAEAEHDALKRPRRRFDAGPCCSRSHPP